MGLHGKGQTGFTLLEVLVAMLVFGIAVMAFVGLQVRALGTTSDAHLREQAVALASELVERIRVNPGELATYRTAALYDGAATPAGAPPDWPAGLQCLAFDAVNNDGCTPAQMARFDINDVEYLAGQQLPDGRVQFHTCASLPELECVVVAWRGMNPADCKDATGERCIAMQVALQ